MTKESDFLFEASDVIPMFPTLVWKVQLKRELHTAINARMRNSGPVRVGSQIKTFMNAGSLRT